MEHEVKVTISHKFSDEDLNDLVSTALEGGINYWCGNVKVKEGSMSEKLYDSINSISDAVSKGGTLVFYDAESDDTWEELDRDKLLKGIQMHCENNNVAPSDLMDMYDADDADSIIQYAVFDELIFS